MEVWSKLVSTLSSIQKENKEVMNNANNGRMLHESLYGVGQLDAQWSTDTQPSLTLFHDLRHSSISVDGLLSPDSAW